MTHPLPQTHAPTLSAPRYSQAHEQQHAAQQTIKQIKSMVRWTRFWMYNNHRFLLDDGDNQCDQGIIIRHCNVIYSYVFPGTANNMIRHAADLKENRLQVCTVLISWWYFSGGNNHLADLGLFWLLCHNFGVLVSHGQKCEHFNRKSNGSICSCNKNEMRVVPQSIRQFSMLLIHCGSQRKLEPIPAEFR